MVNTEVLQRICTFFVSNPDELARLAKNARSLKLGVPLAALRWLAEQAEARGAVDKLEIEAAPPGLRLKADVELKGTPVRIGSWVAITGVRLRPGEFRIELRVSEVTLELLDDAVSPLSMLVKSGALDLSKIGNLVAVLPKRPPFLVEAEGDRIVLDLARHPALARPLVEGTLTALTPLLTVTEVASAEDHVDLKLGLLQQGLSGAVSHWRSLLYRVKKP